VYSKAKSLATQRTAGWDMFPKRQGPSVTSNSSLLLLGTSYTPTSKPPRSPWQPLTTPQPKIRPSQPRSNRQFLECRQHTARVISAGLKRGFCGRIGVSYRSSPGRGNCCSDGVGLSCCASGPLQRAVRRRCLIIRERTLWLL